MGYTIGIQAKNETVLDEMVSFMEEQYRPWPKIIGTKDDFVSSGRPTSEKSERGLDYFHGKLALGINYKSHLCGWEREYAYALTRWLAIRVGKKRSAFPKLEPKIPPFAKPVPFMLYDGHEPWPILVGTAEESKKRLRKTWWCCTDTLGVHNSPEADCEYMNHVIFSSEKFVQLHNDTVKKFGGWPATNTAQYRDKVFMYMLKDPKLKAAVDASVKPLRDELQRLDLAWQSR